MNKRRNSLIVIAKRTGKDTTRGDQMKVMRGKCDIRILVLL